MLRSLVGSEMCIRDSDYSARAKTAKISKSILGHIMEKIFLQNWTRILNLHHKKRILTPSAVRPFFMLNFEIFVSILLYENTCLNPNYSNILRFRPTHFSGLVQHKSLCQTLSTRPPDDVPLRRGSTLKMRHSAKFTVLRAAVYAI